MLQTQIVVHIHKIIKSLVLQPIPFFSVNAFKNAPITFTPRRRNSLTQNSNCKLLQIRSITTYNFQDKLQAFANSEHHNIPVL